MLNLPRVTGWGTDTIASTMMKKSADDRDKETERTRMIGNALLQQAKEGNLNDSGFSFLNEKFPELAKGAEQENIKVQSVNAAKLEKMKLEKIELGGKLFDQKIDAAAKFGDESVYGAGGREFQKAALEEARTYAKMMGKEFNVSAAMDAIDIKKAQKKFKFEVLQENIKGIQSNATPERIAGVERSLGEFASKNKGDPSIPMMEKMIATAKSRLEKEAEIKEKKAEEGRKKDAEIAKESRAETAPTDDIKEYNLAVKQGETGTFTEWMRGNKKETGRLTVGAVSKSFFDYALQVGDNTLGHNMFKRFKELEKTGMAIEDAYVKTYDELSVRVKADVGDIRPVPGQTPQATPSQNAPALSEKDIKYNMTKYKKTRKEVMDAYNQKYGTK